MYFQIDPPGSDYTRVQLDVPNGQLEEIIRAVTTAGHTASETPSWREWEMERRPRPTNRPAAKDTDDRQPPRWLWNLLTEDLRGLPDPRCVVCDRAVSFGDRKSARGGLFAVDPGTREACVACRKCVAHGRAQTLADALRPVAVDSVLDGELVGVRLPSLGGQVHVVRAGQMPAHAVLTPLVGDGGDGDVEARGGHVGRVDPDHLGFTGVPSVLEPEAAGAVRGAGSGEAQQETDVPLGISVEAEDQGRVGERDLQADGVIAHGGSFGGCRCAGATRPDGAGEAEPTKTEALLEEAVELLKSVALSVAPPVIRFPENAAFTGRVKPEDLLRPVWPIPADDMGVSFAGTTVADEDACRRVDDVDQDGPDYEGPEGGESA